MLWKRVRTGAGGGAISGSLDRAAIPLLGAAAVVPLALFATVALGSEVEANWSAMYLVGAAPFLAVMLRPWGRWVLAAAGANLLLATLYVLNAATAFPPLPDEAERALRETRGFEALAGYVAELDQPLVADRYQFAAMINFYQPQLQVSQWPGITRQSEYDRGAIAPLPDADALQRSGFWLLARKFSPPAIAGFRSIETRSVYSCKDGQFSVVAGAAAWDAGGCDEPANVWRLYRYEADPAAQGFGSVTPR